MLVYYFQIKYIPYIIRIRYPRIVSTISWFIESHYQNEWLVKLHETAKQIIILIISLGYQVQTTSRVKCQWIYKWNSMYTCGQVNFGRPLSVPEYSELRQLDLVANTNWFETAVPFVTNITHCVPNCTWQTRQTTNFNCHYLVPSLSKFLQERKGKSEGLAIPRRTKTTYEIIKLKLKCTNFMCSCQ